MLDSVTWGAFTLTFTILGGVGAWLAYRRRGLRSGLRWTASTLLVPAAYFTRTLRMLGRIGSAIADWAASFVWNPLVWVGLGLAVVSLLLFFVAARLPSRERRVEAGSRADRKAAPAGRPAAAVPGSDPELAEIEALLKRRGIS
jgi:HAMP domain-containing protein